jgi:hypothetical protein
MMSLHGGCVKIPFVSSGLVTVTAVAALGLSMIASSAGPAVASARSSAVNAPVFTLPLKIVGQVNLSGLARAEHRQRVLTQQQGAPISRATVSGRRYRAVDNALVTRHAARGASAPSPARRGLSTRNVPGEFGFAALSGVQQAATAGGVDLEPPDQGLCAGGGYVMEFVNNALAIYDKSGSQLLAPIGSAQAFKQPASDFLSDPRCYYDAPTKRWFYQEFVIGKTTSRQFEAVSNTQDPTGGYTVYSWNTTDAKTKGCPCFGDYDNLGADSNGIYVTTDQFAIAPTGPFNGVVIYAISKAELESAAQTGILPAVVGYRLTKDPFGQPYIVAPASTPPGGRFAPGTEYFVESNGNAGSDNHLVVYAMNDTSELTLASSGPPALYRTEVTTQRYAVPSDATQKPGPRPLGAAYQAPAGGIQADFDAAMEPTYTDGDIYAQLDTGTASGSNAAAWFILRPALSGTRLSARLIRQGMVAVKNTSLLYPYTAVNAKGQGYLLFSLSGAHNYPSPAYISYGAAGPTGPVIEATAGAAPEDGFTCYAAFVGPNYGGCRWGDYSMGVFSDGRVFMATEMIPQSFRDTLTNWGTYIWSAPPPSGYRK